MLEVMKLSILMDTFKYLPLVAFYGLIILFIYLFIQDKYQKQHAILKTHPILGRLRYIFEMVGPEFRQYWFLNDKEGRPIDRDTAETIAKAGKYANTVIGFGSKRDFSKTGFYLTNSMFPLNVDELKADNEPLIQSYTYKIISETITKRKEKRNPVQLKPWYLTDDEAIVIGPEREKPFVVKGLIGISARSYGALSKRAGKALAHVVALSGGSFMQAGEVGIYHFHVSGVYEVAEPNEELMDRLREEIVHFITQYPNISNFDLEERFGKGVMFHVDT